MKVARKLTFTWKTRKREVLADLECIYDTWQVDNGSKVGTFRVCYNRMRGKLYAFDYVVFAGSPCRKFLPQHEIYLKLVRKALAPIPPRGMDLCPGIRSFEKKVSLTLNFSLEFRERRPHTDYIDDIWELLVSGDASSAISCGDFKVTKNDHRKSKNLSDMHHFISEAFLHSGFQGMGVGVEVYKGLIDIYGTLESDHFQTSANAFSVWRKLGALELPDQNDSKEKRYRMTKEMLKD